MFKDYTFKSGDYSTWPTITKDTTIEELKFIHQKIWNYAIEHGEKPDTPYKYDCVACEWSILKWHRKIISSIACISLCSFCPIVWPDELICRHDDSLFDQWWRCARFGHSKYWGEGRSIAQKIRDVEWKEKRHAIHDEGSLL